MKILAIETSSQACSVALSFNDQINQKHEILNNQHSQYLLSFIDDLLSESSITKSELDLIAVGNGPGSFTGLRLGLGVAQGLAYGLNKPLMAVSSLLSVAAQSDQQYLLVATDARMNEVYWQCLEKQGNANYIELTKPNLNKPAELSLPEIKGSWHGIGSGWDMYFDQLQAYLDNPDDYIANILPQAGTVVQIAHRLVEHGKVDQNQLVLPVYIRNQIAG